MAPCCPLVVSRSLLASLDQPSLEIGTLGLFPGHLGLFPKSLWEFTNSLFPYCGWERNHQYGYGWFWFLCQIFIAGLLHIHLSVLTVSLKFLSSPLWQVILSLFWLSFITPTQACAPPSSSCILTVGILPYSVALSLSFSVFPFEGPYIIKVEDERDEIAASQYSAFCFGLLMVLSSLGLESAMVGGVWMFLAWP